MKRILFILLIAAASACSANSAATPTPAPSLPSQTPAQQPTAGPTFTALPRAVPTLNQACAWLPQADVESALGMPIQPPIAPSGSSGVLACTYVAQSDSNVYVTLTIYHGDQQLNYVKAQMADSSARPVSGIGDQTVMVQNIMYIRVGTNYASIMVNGQPKKEEDIALTLAPKVVDQLKNAGS